MGLFAELKRRNVIRVGIAYVLVAWVVLQIIDFLLELTDAPSWVLQVFFITAAVGLPVVAVLSWIYELTPEGVKLEKDVDRSSTITPETGRKLDRTIIAMLAMVIVLLLVGQFSGLSIGPRETPESAVATSELVTDSEPEVSEQVEKDTRPSIAVLPFVNMSSDPEQEYFSDGISEEILNSLAGVEALKVAGRTSSFVFKGRNQDLREIGEALGVEHILEGSVRKQGDQVRITAQLIKADDGFHLWSDTFDRSLEDIFAIQDEIANRILLETRTQLLDEQAIASKRADPAAYQNYIAAKQRIHERTKAGLVVAMNLLKDAVEIDPEFASAWAQLAIATMLSSDGLGSYGDIPEEEAQMQGLEYAKKALELEPDLPEGLSALGMYWQNQPPFTRENMQKSVGYLERSLALNPVPLNTSHWLQRALAFLGEHGRRQPILEALVERDPLYWPAVSNLISVYIQKSQFEQAHLLNNRTVRYRPELPYRLSGNIRAFEGQPAIGIPLALETWQKRKDLLTLWSLSRLLKLTGQFERIVEEGSEIGGWDWIEALAHLGRREEAELSARQWLADFGRPGPLLTAWYLSGEFSQLTEFVESNWPDLEQFQEEFGSTGGDGAETMIKIAHAYDQQGKDERFRNAMAIAAKVNEQSVEFGFDNFYLDVTLAQYWALAGNDEKALEYLEEAIDAGFSVAPRLSSLYPPFKALEGEPAYEQLQARSLAHLNEQRALLDLPALEPAY